ncbi:MAG: hypothetical protein MI741_10960, partial [Rhodospirillales bacterium]|nr:hypothetical protein [Rhodospirillales bacterium]
GKTYTNLITAITLGPASLPMVLRDDHEAILVAIKTCNDVKPEDVRLVRIKNTNELNRIQVSESVLQDIGGRDDLKVLGTPSPLRFDDQNNLM